MRAALEEQDNMSNGEMLQGMYKTNPKTDKQVGGQPRSAQAAAFQVHSTAW